MKLKLTSLPKKDGSKVVNSNKKVLYKIGTTNYGDLRRPFIVAILSGKLTGETLEKFIAGEEINIEETEKNYGFRECKKVVGFDMTDVPKMQVWIVAEEKNIAALTNSIIDFYSNEAIKKAGVQEYITLCPICEEYVADVKLPVKSIENPALKGFKIAETEEA